VRIRAWDSFVHVNSVSVRDRKLRESEGIFTRARDICEIDPPRARWHKIIVNISNANSPCTDMCRRNRYVLRKLTRNSFNYCNNFIYSIFNAAIFLRNVSFDRVTYLQSITDCDNESSPVDQAKRTKRKRMLTLCAFQRFNIVHRRKPRAQELYLAGRRYSRRKRID